MREWKYVFAAVAASVALIFSQGFVTGSASTDVHYQGVVRYEADGWKLLDNATHVPSGLGAVECESDGEVRIDYLVPLQTVGTSSVTVDETYVGKFAVGASVGLSAVYVTFRKSDGTTVPCYSSALRLPNSNFWVSVNGKVAS